MAGPGWPVVEAAILAGAEIVVLSSAVVLFGTIASAVPAMLYGIGTFVAGHTLADILAISGEQTTGLSRALIALFRWAIPDLTRFDMRLHALHGVAIGTR